MLTYLKKHPVAAAPSSCHGVLLLHAFPLSAQMWTRQLAPLADAGYWVIAPNSFGIEGSALQNEWIFTDYAHEVARLLEQEGLERVTVVGLSMGGYQAFEFCRLYPEKVCSLVLCDTRAEADSPDALTNRQAFLTAVKENGAAEAAARMIPNYFSPASYTTAPELIAEAERIILAQSPAVINAAMQAIMCRNDATTLLDSIQCPVLVLNGEHDRLTDRNCAENIINHCPGARLRIIAQAGHISNMEQPETFNRFLLEHLGEVNGC